MRKYNNFLLESNEDIKKDVKKKSTKEPIPDVKIVYSKKFKDVLNNILNLKTSNISKRLLDLEKSDSLFDISYIDVSGEDVSYLPSNRIDRFNKENKPIEEYWTSKSRTTTTINRFVKKLLGSKFSDVSVEKFGNKYKSLSKIDVESINFEIVDGDDIVYWYNADNYDNDNGTLGGSCMSYSEAGAYLNMYSNNPNQCKMLILKTSNGDKIRGRALVWKLSDPENKVFMDRVYTNKDADVNLFINYAKNEGWLHKDIQKYGDTNIVDNGKSMDLKMKVSLENTEFNLYPFCDTFRHFYYKLKVLSNSKDIKKEKSYTLNDTEGRYDEWEGYKNNDDEDVYDSYNNQWIDREEGVMCIDGGYCHNDNAIRLSENGDYAYPNSPLIVRCDYNDKYYLKENVVFSKPLNSWIWKKYAVDVYHDKERAQQPDIIHRFELNKSIGKVGEYWYDLDLLELVDKTKKKVGNKETTEYIYKFKDE